MHSSIVPTCIIINGAETYVGRNTAHGTELLSTSCVTAHIYLFSFVCTDFSSPSFIGVNLTSIRSFAFKGF